MTLTNQEIFDKALFGIRSQNYTLSMKTGGTCAYRGKNGNKCAIGHCITDQHAASWDNLSTGDYPSSSIRDVFWLKKNEYSLFFEDSQIDFLASLQDIHDLIIDKDDFEKKMQNLASEYQLNYTEI